jgi:glycosyltransferase involved in cell wall biosynthesis
MGMTARKVVVMLPALNEEASIGKVIDDVPVAELHKKGYEVKVVIVDGHSTDRTPQIAREKGASVLVQEGRGKGVGVRRAIALCNPQEVVPEVLSLPGGLCSRFRDISSMLDMRYLIMLDADGTYPPVQILDVVNALESGADVVMGSRFLGSIAEGAMTGMNHFGNIVLSNVASFLYQTPCTDLCSGMWGFSSQALRALELDSKHFELEAEMFAESVKKGLRIAEVPIDYLPRVGETKLAPMRAGWTIFSKLMERRFWSAAGEFDMKLTRRPEKSPAPTPFHFL